MLTLEEVNKEIDIVLQTDAYRLIYLYTMEEGKAKSIVEEFARRKGQRLYYFDVARGLVCEEDKRVRNLPKGSASDLFFVLSWLEENAKGFVVFFDINPLLEADPRLLRAFKNFLRSIGEKSLYLKIFMVSSSPVLPADLQNDAFFVDVPLPTREEIADILEQVSQFIGQSLDEELKEEFINALQGMREEDIWNVLRYVLHDGKLHEGDIAHIVRLKKQVIRKSGMLEFVEESTNLEDVGGMKRLKEWLSRKGVVIKNLDLAKKKKVDLPKGILLFGMPGCGKSLVAKAIASEWRLPLLRLDMGMVLGPYVGQSEENIRRAIKIAEAVSPCVLWIDELEKAFSGIRDDSGGGVMKRVFGSFLTWMQEKKAPVFVVATANDVSQMPPEFMRKGRFDEIFYVDFPSEEARREILRIHLKKRGREEWIGTLEGFVPQMKDYSGADIEALVSELVERAFVAEHSGTPFDLKKEAESLLKEFRPLAETAKEQIEKLRSVVKFINAKPVD